MTYFLRQFLNYDIYIYIVNRLQLLRTHNTAIFPTIKHSSLNTTDAIALLTTTIELFPGLERKAFPQVYPEAHH